MARNKIKLCLSDKGVNQKKLLRIMSILPSEILRWHFMPGECTVLICCHRFA